MFTLEISGGCEHRFDCTHTVIIMVLGGELLGTELVGCDDFASQIASVTETKGI